MKTTRNAVTAGTALVLLTLSAVSASAATITFKPSAHSVPLGSTVSLTLTISDLGLADSLSTFDLDVGFDEAVLSFAGATFGDPVLGDQLDLAGLGTVTSVISGGGVVNLFALSFDLPDDLNSLQAASFILVTLTFHTVAAGLSALDIDVLALGDAFGDPLSSTVSGGRVEVTRAVVPEPSILILLLTALTTVSVRRTQRRRQRRD